MQEFLAKHTLTPQTTTNARTEKRGLEKARDLAARASRLFSARGKKVICVDLGKEPLSDSEMTRLMLGPSGTLRAPTLLADEVLVIGYHEEMYQNLFG